MTIPAPAQPARIIILRHGEKHNSNNLCGIGEQRAQALAKQYLGRGATKSLFAHGEQPAAIFAITEHTIETIKPTAQSWGLTVIPYSAPDDDGKAKEEDALNTQTRQAAKDVLADPRYSGKIVIMTWEHDHIANEKLAKEHPEGVTLRQLLNLDKAVDVPESWSDSNYDFFWIVDYTPGSPVPKFQAPIKQEFAAPFDKLPRNDWGTAEPLPAGTDCEG
jgi:hypothetical protein